MDDGPLGQAQLVRATGLDKANVGRLLRTLRDEGAVEVEHDGRPRVWRLAEGESERLDRASTIEQPRGELLTGQRIVRVRAEAGQELALAQALGTKAASGTVVWAARVEGLEAQYLLVLDNRASTAEVTELIQRLTVAGLDAGRLIVDEVMGRAAFRRALDLVKRARPA